MHKKGYDNMATADLDFNLNIKGTPEEIASMLNVAFEYFEGKDGVYFSCARISVGDKDLHLSMSSREEIFEAVSGSDTVGVSALGPFGRYGEIDEVDIFRDMAQVAPKASFTANISGFAGYADQSLRAELADGLLKVSTSYLSDDCRGEGELEYFKSNLPYDEFIELFKLDSEEFDEEMYEEFISDNLCCYDFVGEFFEETDYEDFLELFEVECPLTEDEYSEIVEQYMDMGEESCGEYLEREGFAVRENYTYDPVEKKYIDGRSGAKLKSGVAYSINDEIREYLQSIGHPSDDEAINALSVEDVYAILAGVYGKDDSAEDEESEDDEDEEAEDDCDGDDCAEEETEETEESEESDEDGDDAEEESEEESEEATSEAAADVKDEAEEAEPEAEEAEDTAETESEAEEEKSPAPKKSSRKWIALMIIAVILACIAAAAYFFGEQIFDYVSGLLNTAVRLL